MGFILEKATSMHMIWDFNGESGYIEGNRKDQLMICNLIKGVSIQRKVSFASLNN